MMAEMFAQSMTPLEGMPKESVIEGTDYEIGQPEDLNWFEKKKAEREKAREMGMNREMFRRGMEPLTDLNFESMGKVDAPYKYEIPKASAPTIEPPKTENKESISAEDFMSGKKSPPEDYKRNSKFLAFLAEAMGGVGNAIGASAGIAPQFKSGSAIGAYKAQDYDRYDSPISRAFQTQRKDALPDYDISKLSYNQIKQLDEAGGAGGDGGAANRAFLDDEDKIRKEWQAQSQNTKIINSAYRNIRTIGENPQSAAGQMSLIFSYMKMLDPASTVREGEYANAQNTAGIPEKVRNAYNRAKDGTFLGKDQVSEFVNQSKVLYNTQAKAQKETDDFYRLLAKDRRFNPAHIIMKEYLEEKDDPATEAEKPLSQERKNKAKSMLVE